MIDSTGFRRATELAEFLKTGEPPDDLYSRSLDFLSYIKANPTDCSSVVQHPLGFAIFRWNFGPREALRLHIWSALLPRPEVTVDPRHDHLFKIRSFVLCGQITDHELEISPTTPENPDALGLLAQVTQTGQNDLVESTGVSVRAKQERTRIMNRGDFYEVEAGVFHWSEVTSDWPAATLVSMTTMLERSPLTIIKAGSTGRPLTRRLTVPESLRVNILTQVIDCLGAKFSPG